MVGMSDSRTFSGFARDTPTRLWRAQSSRWGFQYLDHAKSQSHSRCRRGLAQPNLSLASLGNLTDRNIVLCYVMSHISCLTFHKDIPMAQLKDHIPSPESVLTLLKERRSIRLYKPDPVPDEMLEQLLEAGRWAPSASNRQPWAFIVVRDEVVRREVARHAAFHFIRWAQAGDAPLLIVLCGDARSRIYRSLLHEDIGLAGSQIMLQAKALGLGTCWLGGLDRKAIVEILKVPDHVEIVGILTVGFPAEAPDPRPRKSLSEIVHYDVYGNQADGEGVRMGRVSGGLLRNLTQRLRLTIRPGSWFKRRKRVE